MDNKEIKIGETYYIRVKADSKDSESVYCQLIDADGNGRKALSFYNWMLYAFTPVPVAPKYDPCRLFKKGDRVKSRIVYGRKPVCGIDGVAAKINSVELIVESNEGKRENGTVDIKFPCGTIGQIDPVYLELVTPVEELEPYSVGESTDYFSVDKDDEKLSLYWKDKHPHAKEAAEAECARLNAEHRKKQNERGR